MPETFKVGKPKTREDVPEVQRQAPEARKQAATSWLDSNIEMKSAIRLNYNGTHKEVSGKDSHEYRLLQNILGGLDKKGLAVAGQQFTKMQEFVLDMDATGKGTLSVGNVVISFEQHGLAAGKTKVNTDQEQFDNTHSHMMKSAKGALQYEAGKGAWDKFLSSPQGAAVLGQLTGGKMNQWSGIGLEDRKAIVGGIVDEHLEVALAGHDIGVAAGWTGGPGMPEVMQAVRKSMEAELLKGLEGRTVAVGTWHKGEFGLGGALYIDIVRNGVNVTLGVGKNGAVTIDGQQIGTLTKAQMFDWGVMEGKTPGKAGTAGISSWMNEMP